MKPLPLFACICLLLLVPVFAVAEHFSSGSIVLNIPAHELSGIVEELSSSSAVLVPSVSITVEEAEAYRSVDAEFRQRIAKRAIQNDLDLHYSLKDIGSDRVYGVATEKDGSLRLYQQPDAHTAVIGYIKLPANISVINIKDNFLKLRVFGGKSVWLNVHDLGSQEFQDRILADIENSLLNIEAQLRLQRCYYKDSFLERAFWGGAGVLGSAALLADGLTRSGVVAFSGTSMAGVAQSMGTVLGAVEVLGGLYIGWNSVAYLVTPQERYVYREWDGKNTSDEKTTVQVEHASEAMVPFAEPEVVPDGPELEQY